MIRPSGPAEPQAIGNSAPPPWHGSSPAPTYAGGGAARQFASDRHFHRGIQAEATCRAILGKATRYQRLAESRLWRAGFFCVIQGIQFVEATTPEASHRKPPAGKLFNWHVFFVFAKLPSLTYPLIIEPTMLQSCGGYIPPHLTVSAYIKSVIVRAPPSTKKGNNRESAFETQSNRLRRQRDADRHNDTRAAVRAPLRRRRSHAGVVRAAHPLL